MKRNALLLLFTILTSLKLISQPDVLNYAAHNVPDSLKEMANAVYVLDEGFLDITGTSKYTFTTHQIITLLNRDAAHHLSQTLHYNKFEKIEDIEFKIYNSEGNIIRVYNKKDFKSKNYIDEISLYTDDRLLYLEAASPDYPCTVEIICKRKITSYIELPDWIIAIPNEAVEHSSFTVKVVSSLNIKYRALNIDLKPTIKTDADSKIYKWTVNNIIASKPEANSYSSYNLPRIEIVAEEFEYDGFKGSFKNWQSFGAWNYQFYEDKSFNNEDIQRFQSLVAHCKTDREKISTLYTYLKVNMRYVSIQLGIGGFKPFPVGYVNDKRYGDCKALTNYMRYMLKAVGINSYPALINAGYNKKPADIDFPSDPFNHVILCVPLLKDSVWLECTSNNNECGFLGRFTENKNALLLTDKGGVLVSTPKSRYNNNILNTKTIIILNKDGSSAVQSALFCTGDFWNMFYYIMQQSQDQKKDIFINYLHYKIPEKFEIETKPDSADGKLFNLILAYDQQYDFKTSNKLFFKPNINAISTEDIKPALRRYDYIFDFPYNKTDTTIYILPEGAAVDKLPLKKDIENDYGLFKNEYTKNEPGTMVTVISNLILKKNIVPPEEYLKVALFFQDVKKIETEKFIVKMN